MKRFELIRFWLLGLLPFLGVQPIIAQSVKSYTRTDTTSVGWQLIRVWEKDLCGLIDFQGNEVLAPTYDTIAFFQNGRAAVSKGDKVGFIDPTGRLVIPLEYEYMCKKGKRLKGFTNNYSEGQRKGHFDFIVDGKGKVVKPTSILTNIEYKTYDLPRFVHPNASLVKRKGLYGLIDNQGRDITKFSKKPLYYLTIISGPMNKKEEQIIVDTLFYTGDDTYFLSPTGRKTTFKHYENPIKRESPDLEKRYTKVHELSSEGGLTIVWKDKLCGMINKNGQEVIPVKYEYIRWALFDEEGIAPAKRKGKWGFLNTEGKEIVPCIYDGVGEVCFGRIGVVRNGKQGFVDTVGHIVVPLKFKYGKGKVKAWDNIFERTAHIPYYRNEQVAIVLHKGNWGLIDRNGNPLTEFKYKSLKEDGDSTLFRGVIEKDKKSITVYLDSNGREFATREERGRALSADSQKAKIDWIDFASQTSGSTWQLQLGIRSATKIENVSVLINGQPATESERGIKPASHANYDMMPSQLLNLNVGKNVVRVVVKNAAGETASERTITRLESQHTKSPNGNRLALVIGNSQYKSSTIAELNNPENDASQIAEKLRSLGFEVMTAINADRRTMNSLISEFGNRAHDFDAAIFYFAGHGLQIQNAEGSNNYLVPIDADEMDYDDDVADCCVNAGSVLSRLDDAQCPTKIIILDACRNNPLKQSWRNAVGGDGGLLKMDASEGTYIAYATGPGRTALDGSGKNSPFAEALLENIDQKGVEVELCFKHIRAKVKEKTQSRQIPWTVSSLVNEFYFKP